MSGPDVEAQCSNTSASEPEGQDCANESLAELLQEYEEKFKYRYTEQDSKYMEVVNKPLPPPPVVFPWFVQNRRSYDRSHKGTCSTSHDFLVDSKKLPCQGLIEHPRDNRQERHGHGAGDRDNSWHRGGRPWENQRRGYQDYGGSQRGYRDREDYRGYRDRQDRRQESHNYHSYQQRPRRDY
ncbi:hypothetical protein HPB50_024269 [Hyalomma asiaticum]|uniref:Uncharacterized protein n=1 Tax=Hyalomma asiaticum TaxID=266040 RepID=A0ACB7SBE1_HYAAI|nr:hypothetical protein HPB50_024269 [Hyalomma asiaticum]